MELKDIKAVYFIGAGGIGMSAIARFFMNRGVVAAGYDKMPTALTKQLEVEGMLMHYEENIEEIPHVCKNSKSCLVVYTPAVPDSHAELRFFRSEGFEVQKRAQVLGELTRAHSGLCVAGTHGKTTTSAMCAHIMHQSTPDCNAFLGGIAKNYGTNYILSESNYVVVEADEYDRSFHWLRPWISVVTATDPDHLDIYGTKDAYLESFAHYTSLIKPGGALIVHTGLEMRERLQPGVRRYTYGRCEGDFHADNIRIGGGEITFDFVSPVECVDNVRLGQPVPVNIENGVAAMAMAQLCGCKADELRYGMASYNGVERRFDFKLRTQDMAVISDYAHHPAEIMQSVTSMRELYAGRRVAAIFQPHLYSRTRDFYKAFADSLGLFDSVALCDIYPAREEPIPGVTSQLIYDSLRPDIEKAMIRKEEIPDYVRSHDFDVLMLLGAGDIDNYAPQVAKIVQERQKA